jgi:hypothetical protein
MKIKIPRWYLLGIPLACYALGVAMNFVVIAHNNGQMPVLYPGGCIINVFQEDPIHVCMNTSSHWKFLADWIVINNLGVASPGDLLIWVYKYWGYSSFVAWFTLLLKDINPNL